MHDQPPAELEKKNTILALQPFIVLKQSVSHVLHDQPPAELEKKNTILVLQPFIVLKQSVSHVVLLRHGQNLQDQNPNILAFINKVYLAKESRPYYICVDKACTVLKHIAAQGHWDEWSQTTQFIVDTPTDGSAPNLVITATASDGTTYQKRAFNTQACEQLNAWLGGFDSILKRMTSQNYNWFIHTILSYHTRKVLQRQAKKGGVTVTDQLEAGGNDDND
ncbi:LOW QUALITY PROTEIN: hypothetical protein CVT25_006598 [Psilocybe cyanescens]|uniref:Uncharacterized protein n=1 Tax=Psilocybe cyanescens TaxID=93625 RepID=A0A409XKQ7_PSICY|nr:LOW QUALITY PROTEIN: hypothetical protein CVT25_006598 [Psilocybe cyanescens]